MFSSGRSWVLLALVGTTLLFVGVDSSRAEPGIRRFTNLKVLPEDVSAAQLNEVMKLMTRALGVQCIGCHESDERRYESDALPRKNIALEMMRLEEARRPELDWRSPPDDLCASCHLGKLRPITSGQGN